MTEDVHPGAVAMPVRDTTLWDLLVSIAEHDTEKHLTILRFIHSRAAEAAH